MHPLTGASWRLDVMFRLRWDMAITHGDTAHVPALYVSDEGQDLAWFQPDQRAGMVDECIGGLARGRRKRPRRPTVPTLTGPCSQSGTTSSTSNTGWFMLRRTRLRNGCLMLFGSIGSSPMEHGPTAGPWTSPTMADQRCASPASSLFVRTSGHLEASLTGWSLGDLTSRVSVNIDEHEPRLLVTAVQFLQVNSTSLDAVPLEVTVQDVERPVEDGVTAHWRLLRQGRVMDGSEGSSPLGFEVLAGGSAVHAGTVDLRPSAFEVMEGDMWQVWFTATDAAGRPAIGAGSVTEPVTVTMR